LGFQGEKYEVSANLYDISVGLAKEVDLRSAQERGLAWVAWAHAERMLDRGLLIIGGGICGYAAACAAIELGVRVALVTDTGVSMGRFAGSARWVHPTLYVDWPHRVSSVSLNRRWLPGAPPALRELAADLGWGGQRAGELSARWSNALADRMQGVRLIMGRAKVSPVEDESASVHVRRTADAFEIHGHGASSEAWGVALVCIGPHVEQTTLPNRAGSDKLHPSFAYWDCQDPLWSEPSEVPPTGELLIVGAGDGGQQDLFRLATGRDPVETVLAIARAEGEGFWAFTEQAKGVLTGKAAFDRHHGEVQSLLLADAGRWLRAVQTWIAHHAPIRPEVVSRIRVVEAAEASMVRCFALNRVLTTALFETIGGDARARYGVTPEAVCDMTPPDVSHADAAACAGEAHAYAVPEALSPVTRFILRINQQTKWLAGPPRWAVDADRAGPAAMASSVAGGARSPSEAVRAAEAAAEPSPSDGVPLGAPPSRYGR
jgi:hypothetical protein